MTASQIYRRLHDRHRNKGEWCFKEVSISGMGSQRMDAWVVCPGYPEHTIGYEIKVSRSDFKQDKKWHNYLPYCNEFFFACPAGMIKPEEIEHPAGLVWIGENRIFEKKPSLHDPFRLKHEYPTEFLMGLIINKLNPSVFKTREERIKEFKRGYGYIIEGQSYHAVGKKIHDLQCSVNEKARNNDYLDREIERLKNETELGKLIKNHESEIKCLDEYIKELRSTIKKLKDEKVR